MVSISVENQEASKYHMTQVEIYHLFVFGLAIDNTPPVIECYKLQDEVPVLGIWGISGYLAVNWKTFHFVCTLSSFLVGS